MNSDNLPVPWVVKANVRYGSIADYRLRVESRRSGAAEVRLMAVLCREVAGSG